MKRISLLVILVLLAGMVFKVNAQPQIFFTEDFENGGVFPSGWTLDPGTGDDWAIDDGTYYGPGSAHSGSYTAMFNDYDYSSGTTAQMITPAIDLSSTQSGDYIVLSYWYWDGDGSDQVEVLASTDGTNFTPIDTTASTVDPWTQQFVNLSAYAGQATVYISFKGTSVYGFTNPNVDDIRVYKVPADDLAADALYLPTSHCAMVDTIRMAIVNAGTAAQNNYAATYSIDGGTTWITPENITTTLNPGDTLIYTFTTLADFSTPTDYNVMAAVVLSGDADNSNDTVSGTYVSQPLISSYPYTQDFEGTQYWFSGGTNSSWQLGTPAGTVINSAASGSNAWVTNLTGEYNPNEFSYVESPCFDFSTLHNPVVQFNYWLDAEAYITSSYDGARLDYSLDKGATWETVGSLSDWSNWYNMAYINGLSGQGWSGSGAHGSNGWIMAKHLLTSLAGQPSVKFRIVFGSDGSVQYEGFAFDDFTIREGEVNLAITEINYNGPESGTDTTEFIEWYNYGQDAVNLNGYYYSQGVTDTLPDITVLPDQYFVSAGDSAVIADFYGYTGAIQWYSGGLSNGGENIALHTSWGALVDSVYYDDAGGWPTQADGYGPSLVFCDKNLGSDQNDASLWTVSTSFVGLNNNGDAVYGSPGALDSACYRWDLAIAHIQTGDTIADCDFSATDTAMIPLTNVGNQVIPAGDTIFGWYQLNTDPVVADTMVLYADFNPGDTVIFIFYQTVDLSALGYYNAGLWFNYYNDNEQSNDTAYITLYHYEPVVDLGPDTIWTAQPDTLVLDAGAGFESYLWQDGSTDQTYNVQDAGTYYVIAVDSNGCSASDTVVVELLPDITFVDPEDGMHYYACDFSANEAIDVNLTNLGDTIPANDSIFLWYQVNNETPVADTLVLSADFNQNDTINFQFSQTYDFSALGDYNWKVWLSYASDVNALNDTASGILTHYEPVVDLGPDTIRTLQPDTVVLDAGAGFESYLWQDGSTDQTYQVTDYGTYYVTAVDSNGCSASDTVVVDTINAGAIDQITLSGVRIYPNPNNGQFVIDLPRAENVKIEILSVSGKVVYSTETANAHNEIDLTKFSKGVYIVRLRSDNAITNYKIVIE